MVGRHVVCASSKGQGESASWRVRVTGATTLTTENVIEIMRSYDCVMDCSDNPQTRYLINDACGKPES